jgi:cytochrome d ubiquinol oxidase subunit I
MNALTLSRVQFALTTSVHFLFVTLTLGLVLIVAVLQTRYVRTGDERYARMAKFWGKIYIVNYAMGIVTGIVMEFQFGLNWEGLTNSMGNVFGAPLAMETLVAFFAESTFLGMWIFGWGRLPKRLHLATIWLVAVTAYLSAYWVLVANGFLQHPVGYTLDHGQARITDLTALLTNPFTLVAFGHIAAGALMTGGCLVAGISAYHLRRRTGEPVFFRRSLRVGLITGAMGILPAIGLGIVQFVLIKKYQMPKDAAFNDDPLQIAKAQAAMVAKYGPGDYRVTTVVTHAGNAMMYSWTVLTIVLVIGLIMLRRGAVYRAGWLHRTLTYCIPLPFVANLGGWLLRELGRQPWAVYGVLRTSDAASHVSTALVAGSLTVFAVLFVVLATTDYLLMAKIARGGPEPVFTPDRELVVAF